MEIMVTFVEFFQGSHNFFLCEKSGPSIFGKPAEFLFKARTILYECENSAPSIFGTPAENFFVR